MLADYAHLPPLFAYNPNDPSRRFVEFTAPNQSKTCRFAGLTNDEERSLRNKYSHCASVAASGGETQRLPLVDLLATLAHDGAPVDFLAAANASAELIAVLNSKWCL